jgi:hypothetical protein
MELKGGSVLQRCKAPLAPHDARLLRSLSVSAPAFNGGERDSPKIIGPIVLFEKFYSVRGDSLKNSQLRDHTGRHLSTTLISYNDSRPNRQLTIQLDGSSMPVQVGGFGGHRKGTFLAILTR